MFGFAPSPRVMSMFLIHHYRRLSDKKVANDMPEMPIFLASRRAVVIR
jgi:hypothetical protein